MQGAALAQDDSESESEMEVEAQQEIVNPPPQMAKQKTRKTKNGKSQTIECK